MGQSADLQMAALPWGGVSRIRRAGASRAPCCAGRIVSGNGRSRERWRAERWKPDPQGAPL